MFTCPAAHIIRASGVSKPFVEVSTVSRTAMPPGPAGLGAAGLGEAASDPLASEMAVRAIEQSRLADARAATTPVVPTAPPEPEELAAVSPTEMDDLAQIEELEYETGQLRALLDAEEEEAKQLKAESLELTQRLGEVVRERTELEARLERQQRADERQHGTAKLLKLQLSVTQQLRSVAEGLAQVPSFETADGSPAAQLRHREREVEELRRALRRQQQLSHDAHRQLLELATKRKPVGAGSTVAEVDALRAALGEQVSAPLPWALPGRGARRRTRAQRARGACACACASALPSHPARRQARPESPPRRRWPAWLQRRGSTSCRPK